MGHERSDEGKACKRRGEKLNESGRRERGRWERKTTRHSDARERMRGGKRELKEEGDRKEGEGGNMGGTRCKTFWHENCRQGMKGREEERGGGW